MRTIEISDFDTPEDRIAALENRVQKISTLVEGLLAEMLDFRAVATTLARESGERGRQVITRGPVVQEAAPPASAASPAPAADTDSSRDSTVIRSGSAGQPRAPSAPAEPAMVRIMQSDGTMKMEPRRGGTKAIDSSAGYGQNRKTPSAGNKKTSRK